MARKIAEGPAPAGKDAADPGELGRHVDEVLELERGRHREAVFDVAVTLAQDLEIDGEHQRAAFGGLCAFDQRAHETPVPHDIELEPERFGDRPRHVLDRADRHGRERVGNARRLRGAAGENLAIAMHEARHRDGRENERQRDLLAEDGGRGRRSDTSTSTRWRSLIFSSRRGWRARSVRNRSRPRHSRRRRAAPGGGRPAAGPRCMSCASWR